MDMRRNRRQLWILFCGIALAALLGPLPAHAEIRAGIYVNRPFVMEDGKKYSGIAIDLWEEIAKKLGLETQYVRYDTLGDLVRATRSGDVDVGVTNLSVTHERARALKITHPWYDSDLRMMIREDKKAATFDTLRDNGSLRFYFRLFCMLLPLTFFATAVRRRVDSGFPTAWREGLALSFYDLIVTFKTGRFQKIRFGWLGHILAAAWVIFGITIVSYITSTVASAMTSVSLANERLALDNLRERSVGVFRGSIAESFVEKQGFKPAPYADINEAAEALKSGDISAVVASEPILAYWIREHPNAGLQVVGKPIRPDKFVFCFNTRHTELADRVSLELVKLVEDGAIEEIAKKYLGP